MKKFVILLVFISVAFTMGCSGTQDTSWESSRESHASLLASDFKKISEAENSLDYKTVATYGQHLIDDSQKAIDDNNGFTVSQNRQEAQKEWGLAMRDYNAAGKLMVQAETNQSVISQYSELVKSGNQHADRCNELYKAS
jgi:hypothetical protein